MYYEQGDQRLNNARNKVIHMLANDSFDEKTHRSRTARLDNHDHEFKLNHIALHAQNYYITDLILFSSVTLENEVELMMIASLINFKGSKETEEYYLDRWYVCDLSMGYNWRPDVNLAPVSVTAPITKTIYELFLVIRALEWLFLMIKKELVNQGNYNIVTTWLSNYRILAQHCRFGLEHKQESKDQGVNTENEADFIISDSNAIICDICLKKPKNTVLLTCYHTCCDICAPQITVCHLCRTPVINRARIYL